MGRRILVYGNPDKTEDGFIHPGDLTEYIGGKVFSEENGRYRYTQWKHADIIVLSRDGKAFGHFEILDKIKPESEDVARFAKVRAVYLVGKSILYDEPVQLSELGITRFHRGKYITEKEFAEIQSAAGGISEHYHDTFVPRSTVELERQLRLVRQRLGQSEFRQALLDAYNCKCPVTDCDVLEALEAAHIDSYSESASHETCNGLLLRADVHALFDEHLLAIDPDTFQVVVDETIRGSSYAKFHGRLLTLPKHASDKPSRIALKKRWQRFNAVQDAEHE
jgi:hypothetical protein